MVIRDGDQNQGAKPAVHPHQQSSRIGNVSGLLQGRSDRASRTPPPPPPTPFPGACHYGPKMYLRVSRTQSSLFPGLPLGCTGVIALCTRIHLAFSRSLTERSSLTPYLNHLYMIFMTQWQLVHKVICSKLSN